MYNYVLSDMVSNYHFKLISCCRIFFNHVTVKQAYNIFLFVVADHAMTVANDAVLIVANLDTAELATISDEESSVQEVHDAYAHIMTRWLINDKKPVNWERILTVSILLYQ